MATALTTIGQTQIADPAKLMTPREASALADNPYSAQGWFAAHCAGRIDPQRVPALIAHHDAALRPVSADWLQCRLRMLWKSSVVNGSLDATAWLHETGRLLSDLPKDLLSEAIDLAVMRSERGFMPAVGQIRAIADPKAEERQRNAARLKAIDSFNNKPPAPPEPEAPAWTRRTEIAESTADILKRAWPTMHEHETGYAGGPRKQGLNPDRECRQPSREDYIRLFGIDPEAASDAAA